MKKNLIDCIHFLIYFKAIVYEKSDKQQVPIKHGLYFNILF
jgi:hypothetical protein